MCTPFLADSFIWKHLYHFGTCDQTITVPFQRIKKYPGHSFILIRKEPIGLTSLYRKYSSLDCKHDFGIV